ncbi:MAG TPA: formate dehydrogenase accessory protein FdhE [Dehalococcoidia bacterium]|nr:formate dehydrogenase accessory protein FdhE [Dehalococcoidia bacterium]
MTSGRILDRLDAMEKVEGSLPRLLEFYRKLIQIQTRVGRELNKPNPGLSAEAIHQRTAEGKALITASNFTYDLRLLQGTFRETAALFGEYADLFNSTSEEFSKLAETDLTPDSIEAWYNGEPLPYSGEVNQTLLKELIHAAIKPFLVSYTSVLIDSVEQERWRRGHCPICGGNPDFSFLEKENGARWLLCSRCDTEWLFQRLKCPYCDNTDQQTLSYYTSDEGMYRLYVCDNCKHYLKAIDLRNPGANALIPLERLLTLEIDAQARDYGYSPCE